jgi:hypothetical protein
VFEVGVSRTLAIGATSANVDLTPTCRFISIATRAGTHVHYAIGVGAQTASASSHYLLASERITLAVPPNANIAVIQGSASGTLHISELTQ